MENIWILSSIQWKVIFKRAFPSFYSAHFSILLCLKKQNSTIAEEKMECNCKDVCRSLYPCLLVQVIYRTQNNNNTATSTLYDTDVILNHKVFVIVNNHFRDTRVKISSFMVMFLMVTHEIYSTNRVFPIELYRIYRIYWRLFLVIFISKTTKNSFL